MLGVFLVIGFSRSIVRIFRRDEQGRRSFPLRDTIALSWLVIGLVPVTLADQAPHALRAVIVAPVVYLFVAESLWCAYEHLSRLPRGRLREFAPILLGLLLMAATLVEGHRYFIAWARQPIVGLVFFQGYVELGNALKPVPPSRPVYVYAAPGPYVAIDGMPILAQSVMFITGTYTREKQAVKNFHYVTELSQHIPPGALVVRLTN